MINLPGLPSSILTAHNCPDIVRAARVSLSNTIRLIQEEAERLNNMVFFQAVPGASDLPEMPSGKWGGCY